MERRVFYLETGSQDPCYNLAFEEYVLLHRTDGDYLMLWQNDNTVVVGQNQNTAEEIDPDFVAAHGIRVVRRTTGGGAVYHDLGNLNYSFLTDADDALSTRRFTEPVTAALRGLGLDAEASGRNDILVSGCKVSGTARRLTAKRILHHGTLLFDSDLSMAAGALRADPAKFRSKSAKSVRSRIGNIRSFLPQDMTLEAFWAYLKTALAQQGLEETALTAEELAAVQSLRDTKYASWDWNYGRSPAYETRDRRRFAGGTLEVCLTVKQGVIDDIRFYGDFLSLRELTPLCRALIGCPRRRGDVETVLGRFPLAEFFGSITAEEVSAAVCGTEV